MSTMNAINLEQDHEQDEKKSWKTATAISRYDFSMSNLSKWHIKVIKNHAI